MNSAAIEVRGLRRVFQRRSLFRRAEPEFVALHGLDLTVGKGQVHGLLGPNGAGKTTLCKILSTVLLPTSGTASVCGYDVVADPRAVRKSIGIVFGGDRGLYGRLTVQQNLRHWGALYGLHGRVLAERIDDLLDRFGLAHRGHDRVENFSRGMKQRVHLARGLIGDPEVLLLDEPTDGMDPVGAHDFRSLVADLRAEGKTILITTHDMAEAEQVCDQVSFIDAGRIMVTEPPSVLGSVVSRFERIDALDVPDEVRDRLADLDGVERVELLEDGYVRFHTSRKDATELLLHGLVDHGITKLRNSAPNLEEVYLHLIGSRGMKVR